MPSKFRASAAARWPEKLSSNPTNSSELPLAPPAGLTRDGVSPSLVVLPAGPWTTLLEFLVERFPGVPAATWTARFEAGAVLDEHGVAVGAAEPFAAGRRVYYYRSVGAEARIPFEETVVFHDEWLVVADKPHFLPVIPSGRYVQESLLVRLKRRLGLDDLSPIHRIDRETAGLVVFAVQPATRGAYQKLFAERAVRKRYTAVAHARSDLPLPLVYRSRLEENPDRFMQMREVPGEPNAETRIELLENRGPWARYGLEPITGRKHQLRAQCAALGLPIRHDQIYPVHRAENTDDYAKPLQLLAESVAFTDPISGEPRQFRSARSLLWPVEAAGGESSVV